jgi:hypothetical protein
MRDFKKIHITVEGLDKEDNAILLGLLKTMEQLGSAGASRSVKMFCDGDGSFRPKFTFKGEFEDGTTHDYIQGNVNRFIAINDDDPFF